MGSEDAEREVEAIMKAVDSNGSGSIDYTGKTTIKHYLMNQNLLWQLSTDITCFLKRDQRQLLRCLIRYFEDSWAYLQDGNGYLTADELKEIFNPGNQRDIDDNVWVELIKEVDQNGDGRVSRNFLLLMNVAIL